MRARSLAPDLYNAQAFRSLLASDLGPRARMTQRDRSLAEAKAKSKAKADAARAEAARRAEAFAALKAEAKAKSKAKADAAKAEAERREELKRRAKEQALARRDERVAPDGATPIGGAETEASASGFKLWPHGAALAALAAAAFYAWKSRKT